MNTQFLHNYYQGLPVLVTGGAGFIGSHLVERLVALGAHVTVLDNLQTGLLSNLAQIIHKITFIEGDITNFSTCLQAATGAASIFHLAAGVSVPESQQNPTLYHTLNVTGTHNMLEAARANGVKHFVFSSSSAIYGPHDGICAENTPPNPVSVYGLSKLLGEEYCQFYAKNYPISTACLRYFNVFGARQRADVPNAGIVATLRKKMHHNEPITLFGDGLQQRDFVPVEKVVQANLLCGAVQKPLMGECFNIASGTSKTILQLTKELQEEFPNYGGTIEFLPARPGDVYYSAADCSKFKQMLGTGTL